ncbi:MAG TPA: hypothetical protein VLG11_06150 [Candidatus Saccharimonadales bacterium]|nr:hypothetical protein [Candidatus Saccharimonadales bacterium]
MTELSGDQPLPPVYMPNLEADIVELRPDPVRDPADCADVVRDLATPISPERVRDALFTGFGGLLQWARVEGSGQTETGAADESAALE